MPATQSTVCSASVSAIGLSYIRRGGLTPGSREGPGGNLNSSMEKPQDTASLSKTSTSRTASKKGSFACTGLVAVADWGITGTEVAATQADGWQRRLAAIATLALAEA